MKITIEGEGNGSSSYHVEDAETGEEIKNIRALHFVVSAGEPARVTMEMIAVDLPLKIKDAEAECDWPESGTTKDGTLWIRAEALTKYIEAQGVREKNGMRVLITDTLLETWRGHRPLENKDEEDGG